MLSLESILGESASYSKNRKEPISELEHLEAYSEINKALISIESLATSYEIGVDYVEANRELVEVSKEAIRYVNDPTLVAVSAEAAMIRIGEACNADHLTTNLTSRIQFSGESVNANEVEYSLEGIKDTLKNWWEKVKEKVKELWKKISLFFNKIVLSIKKLFGYNPSVDGLLKKIEELKKKDYVLDEEEFDESIAEQLVDFVATVLVKEDSELTASKYKDFINTDIDKTLKSKDTLMGDDLQSVINLAFSGVDKIIDNVKKVNVKVNGNNATLENAGNFIKDVKNLVNNNTTGVPSSDKVLDNIKTTLESDAGVKDFKVIKVGIGFEKVIPMFITFSKDAVKAAEKIPDTMPTDVEEKKKLAENIKKVVRGISIKTETYDNKTFKLKPSDYADYIKPLGVDDSKSILEAIKEKTKDGEKVAENANKNIENIAKKVEEDIKEMFKNIDNADKLKEGDKELLSAIRLAGEKLVTLSTQIGNGYVKGLAETLKALIKPGVGNVIAESMSLWKKAE